MIATGGAPTCASQPPHSCASLAVIGRDTGNVTVTRIMGSMPHTCWLVDVRCDKTVINVPMESHDVCSGMDP